MEEKREETGIQIISEQIDENKQVQEDEQINEDEQAQENEQVQEEQELHEPAQPETQIEEIEETDETLVEEEILIEEAQIEETTPKDVKAGGIFKKAQEKKRTKSYQTPVTRIGFFLRGALAIALGAVMFLHQDDVLRILGMLLGCAIIVMSGLNLIVGYRDRFKVFYGKWLIIAGVIGIILGVIAVCNPLLISEFSFLFLTFALVILGCGDMVLAIYIKKMPEVRRTLLLLGLLSIAAGVLIYMYQDNVIIFFCIYAVASGILSIAISLFMKSKKEKID